MRACCLTLLHILGFEQTNSITAIKIRSAGLGYVPGDIRVFQSSDSGFIANFEVHSNGSIM
jgi:hypothetical protein